MLQVTPGISPSSGGPSRSVTGLSRALESVGVDVSLCILRGDDEFVDPQGIEVLRGSHALTRERLSTFDLVHLHCLWDLDVHAVAVRCREMRVPYVISPRGMLDPWALSVKRWKKKLGMFLFQWRDLIGAAAIHATAELEASHIRAQGLNQSIIISPNGVNLPKIGETWESRQRVRNGRVALFLGRLHPGKGLVNLARAWARVKPQGWVMRIVGPDSYGHKAEVLSELDRLGIREQWQFRDAVGDVEKWNEYAAAEMLVHPSVSENFGISIAEGLAFGIPVICTNGTPWNDVVSHGCGWWIEQGVEALVLALRKATSLSSADLYSMGKKGSMLIKEKYSWHAAAEAMIRGYEEVLSGRA